MTDDFKEYGPDDAPGMPDLPSSLDHTPDGVWSFDDGVTFAKLPARPNYGSANQEWDCIAFSLGAFGMYDSPNSPVIHSRACPTATGETRVESVLM